MTRVFYLNQSAIVYLVATVLDAIRLVLRVVLTAAWIMPNKDIPYAWNIIDAISNTWLRFVILVLLLIIGNRRQRGVWASVQPWMDRAYSQLLAKALHENTTSQQETPYHQRVVYTPEVYLCSSITVFRMAVLTAVCS